MKAEELDKRIAMVRDSLEDWKDCVPSIEITPAFIRALLEERDVMKAQLEALQEMITFWRNAPFFANYLAMDVNGKWHFHSEEPYMCEGGYWDNDGGIDDAEVNFTCDDWTQSLRRRFE